MLRTTMIVLATAAVLTGGLTADAFARGGGGGGHMGGGGGAHMGGGFGAAHMGGGFGAAHMGGGFGAAHMGGGVSGGIAGQHFAGTRDHFDHGRRVRFGSGVGDLYDYECDYGNPYYNPDTDSCDPPEY
jgi:hypothetical protein